VKSYEDLKQELIEIAVIVDKYPDDVKKQVFELLVSRFLGEEIVSPPAALNETPVSAKPKAVPNATTVVKPIVKTAAKAAKKKSGAESYKIDRDLDLTESADCPSFRGFYAEKEPNTAAEFNAISIYYLIKLKGHKQASLDQAYTCYAEVKRKPADHFKQSFRDTQNKKGYIEFTEEGQLVVPHRGVVFVEHDLPKPKKDKE